MYNFYIFFKRIKWKYKNIAYFEFSILQQKQNKKRVGS